MFKKIVFATSATSSCEAASRVAFNLTKRYQSELAIVNVFGIPSRGYSQVVTDLRTGDEVALHEDHIACVTEEIKQIYGQHVDADPTCKIKIVPGIPHTEILRCARKMDAELIVMGANTSHEDYNKRNHRHIVGRTLQGVTKSARCPVLIIGRPAASFWGDISNIVFASDFSKAANSAFQFAFKLARTFKCRLNFFHAIDISADPFRIMKNQEEIEDNIRSARLTIQEKYIRNLADFKDYDIDVWEGIPYVEIVKYGREKFADLIVMAHHTSKLSPEKALFGSTVAQVVLRANCPVISINHPDKI